MFDCTAARMRGLLGNWAGAHTRTRTHFQLGHMCAVLPGAALFYAMLCYAMRGAMQVSLGMVALFVWLKPCMGLL